MENRAVAKKIARMPWRTKEAIMRWHSYQSLVRTCKDESAWWARPPGAANHSITITSKSKSKSKEEAEEEL